jgi:hypothetical protein
LDTAAEPVGPSGPSAAEPGIETEVEPGVETTAESAGANAAAEPAKLGADSAAEAGSQLAPEAAAETHQELSAQPDAAGQQSAPSSEPDGLTNAPIALLRTRVGQPTTEHTALTFSTLWPEAERPAVRALEEAAAAGDYHRVVAQAEQLVARALAAAAGVIGATSEAPRDPAVVALLLGLEGRRYLEFRALVRDSRAGRPIDQSAALGAYAFVIEVRLARRRVEL